MQPSLRLAGVSLLPQKSQVSSACTTMEPSPAIAAVDFIPSQQALQAWDGNQQSNLELILDYVRSVGHETSMQQLG